MKFDDNAVLQLFMLASAFGITYGLIEWMKDLLPDWFRTLLGIVFVLGLMMIYQ